MSKITPYIMSNSKVKEKLKTLPNSDYKKLVFINTRADNDGYDKPFGGTKKCKIKANTYSNILDVQGPGSDGSIMAKIQIGQHNWAWVYLTSSSRSSFGCTLGYYMWSGRKDPLGLSTGTSSETDRYTSLMTIENDDSVNYTDEYKQDRSEAVSESSSSSSGSTSSTASSSSSSEDDEEIDYSNSIQTRTFFPINWYSEATTNAVNAYNSYYEENMSSLGVDLSNVRGIWGMPYQFLPSTDCRLDFWNQSISDHNPSIIKHAGLEFSDKIISRMPLLFLIPGNTAFLANVSDGERKGLMGNVMEFFKSEDSSTLEKLIGDYNGKLYTIEPAYAEYFRYVNPMCRAGADFLDIANVELDGKQLRDYHWGYYEGQTYEFYQEDIDKEVPEEEQLEDIEVEEDPYVTQFSKPDSTFESIFYQQNCIPFYINSDVTFTDSFSNETTESTLSSAINGLSDKAREIQFLMGTASAAVGSAFDRIDGTLTAIKENIDQIVNKISKGNNIFGTIARSVKTIVSGGRLLFPQIWSNSSFSKSYNITIKLVTPSFDKLSWYYNIYVPMCHLMALVLPRSEYTNSYTTPFLIRGFYKGMFNIDMGIITEMSFQKGKDGGWTKDGLPTVVEVSFTIQDLYPTMSMTSEGNMFSGFTLQNVAELDYLANLCGICMNEPDTHRMINFWIMFNVRNRIFDILPDLRLNLKNTLTNKYENLVNNFWT